MENTKNGEDNLISVLSTTLVVSAMVAVLGILYYLIRVLLRGFMLAQGFDIPVLAYELVIVALWFLGIYFMLKRYKP